MEGKGREKGRVGHPVKKERRHFHWNWVHMWDRAPAVPKKYMTSLNRRGRIKNEFANSKHQGCSVLRNLSASSIFSLYT